MLSVTATTKEVLSGTPQPALLMRLWLSSPIFQILFCVMWPYLDIPRSLLDIAKKLLTFTSAYKTIGIINNLFCSISDHTDLLKRISIGFVAGGLIFKGLSNLFAHKNRLFCTGFRGVNP